MVRRETRVPRRTKSRRRQARYQRQNRDETSKLRKKRRRLDRGNELGRMSRFYHHRHLQLVSPPALKKSKRSSKPCSLQRWRGIRIPSWRMHVGNVSGGKPTCFVGSYVTSETTVMISISQARLTPNGQPKYPASPLIVITEYPALRYENSVTAEREDQIGFEHP